jgi:hypothetical protein
MVNTACAVAVPDPVIVTTIGIAGDCLPTAVVPGKMVWENA